MQETRNKWNATLALQCELRRAAGCSPALGRPSPRLTSVVAESVALARKIPESVVH